MIPNANDCSFSSASVTAVTRNALLNEISSEIIEKEAIKKTPISSGDESSIHGTLCRLFLQIKRQEGWYSYHFNLMEELERKVNRIMGTLHMERKSLENTHIFKNDKINQKESNPEKIAEAENATKSSVDAVTDSARQSIFNAFPSVSAESYPKNDRLVKRDKYSVHQPVPPLSATPSSLCVHHESSEQRDTCHACTHFLRGKSQEILIKMPDSRDAPTTKSENKYQENTVSACVFSHTFPHPHIIVDANSSRPYSRLLLLSIPAPSSVSSPQSPFSFIYLFECVHKYLSMEMVLPYLKPLTPSWVSHIYSRLFLINFDAKAKSKCTPVDVSSALFSLLSPILYAWCNIIDTIYLDSNAEKKKNEPYILDGKEVLPNRDSDNQENSVSFSFLFFLTKTPMGHYAAYWMRRLCLLFKSTIEALRALYKFIPIRETESIGSVDDLLEFKHETVDGEGGRQSKKEDCSTVRHPSVILSEDILNHPYRWTFLSFALSGEATCMNFNRQEYGDNFLNLDPLNILVNLFWWQNDVHNSENQMPSKYNYNEAQEMLTNFPEMHLLQGLGSKTDMEFFFRDAYQFLSRAS